MPAKYQAIKEACLKSGGKTKTCKTKAAKIFNATRKRGEPSLQSVVAKERKGLLGKAMK